MIFLEKKINHDQIVNEIRENFLNPPYEIEKLSDDTLAELYQEFDHHHEIRYPNGNDFL